MPPALAPAARAALDDILNDAVASGVAPGTFFAATSTAGTLYAGGAGVRALGAPATAAVDAESVFWICSMTKLVVSVALIQLIERGRTTYDTPVGDIVPELAHPVVVADPLALEYTYAPAKSPILVRHLLNHTSGLHYYPPHRNASPEDLSPAYNAGAYGGDHSVAKYFELIRNGLPEVPLAFEPGTGWAYGWSSEIVALLVERLTGTTIDAYCKEHIFGPVGMPSATFLLDPATKARLVALSFRRPDGVLEPGTGHVQTIEQDPAKVGIMLGGIGIYASLTDYLALLRHLLLAKDALASAPILSADSVAGLFAPSVPAGATAPISEFSGMPDCQYGHGLCLATADWPGRRRKGSGFWLGWAGTHFFMDPATGVAAVFGTQILPFPDAGVIALWERLERALYAGLTAEGGPAEGCL
ncbi:hypothetical protein HYPSUDRAFT_45259 [Hypholoma sublateritium FD-334 SS-4]|uniref:Beta-lactamase-related domain-containing protein n=1 Tax=Hypholoma sublateritium (strain FD-334 SS-4) TaxID=945553 RepID=A0A0D2NHG4_HYPSF|nr:hypothetical protein HYPSUDRAFT_45259 [Hypholoma sublateritium FD-334 SS-4]